MSVAENQLLTAFDQVSVWIDAFYGEPIGPALAELLQSCRAIAQQTAYPLEGESHRTALFRLREVAEAKLEDLADAILRTRE